MSIKLTKTQKKVLQAEQARVVAMGEQAFLDQHKGKIKEGSEEGEMVAFLKNFFADAFWQGYLYATVERAKADHEQEEDFK
jgi:hypothetical protein